MRAHGLKAFVYLLLKAPVSATCSSHVVQLHLNPKPRTRVHRWRTRAKKDPRMPEARTRNGKSRPLGPSCSCPTHPSQLPQQTSEPQQFDFSSSALTPCRWKPSRVARLNFETAPQPWRRAGPMRAKTVGHRCLCSTRPCRMARTQHPKPQGASMKVVVGLFNVLGFGCVREIYWNGTPSRIPIPEVIHPPE